MTPIPRVTTGLETLYRSPRSELKGKRLGLLANPASVTSNFIHASRVIDRIYPGRLTALFSPQHGFYAEKQDNMIESGHDVDEELGIPIFSLYSSTRIPTQEMFDHIDVLLVDIQDVGTRVYTFIYTLSYCLEAAEQYGKPVIVLDRPNPVGGLTVEGNLLKKSCTSFVGRFPIPMRHGMTVGEMALMFNEIPTHLKHDKTTSSDTSNISYFSQIQQAILKREKKHKCELTVIPMDGWRRKMLFRDTGLPWIAPSPNLPTPMSAFVYPGQVIWEGTNISEGRGTTQPFELFGAPFLETEKILERLESKIPGAVLRPVAFEPTSGKWQGEVCRGFQIHVTSPTVFQPYKTTLQLLQLIIQLHPEEFQWKHPPYEYEYERLPMDLILGDSDLRRALEKSGHHGKESTYQKENHDAFREPSETDLDILEASWQEELQAFSQLSREFHLYV